MRAAFVIEFILMFLIGLLLCYLGFRIWKKQQITLIHDYHYTKVKEKDIKPYTEQMGKACIIMGGGMILSSTINLITNTFYGWIVFVILFILGIIKMISAQSKYNGDII